MPEATVRWLETRRETSPLQDGVSFGMPWPKGLHQPGQAFVIQGDGRQWPLDTRDIAFWPDGSMKWTVHSISGDVRHCDSYTLKASKPEKSEGLIVRNDPSGIDVSNSIGLRVRFTPPGSSSILGEVSLNGRAICSGATVVASVNDKAHSTVIKRVEVENATFARVLLKVSGTAVGPNSQEHLPFDLRVYIYSHAASIKIVHSFIHDLDPEKSLTSLGLRFSVPFGGTELHNRHIRFGGSDGGILKEEVRGLSGLRFGPTLQNRMDQTNGKPVTLMVNEWERTELQRGLNCIPSWNDYTLSQLSSDGFSIKKRTKKGCSRVKVTGGGRADGTAYIGSAKEGGLAVGMSDFWERYPTQLDLGNLTTEEGFATVWMYSPLAEPLDTTPYHDGLGLDTYEKQLEALNVTYEDYEPGFATANGIARTNVFYLRPFESTPSNAALGAFSSLVRSAPRLIPSLEYMHSTGVFHGCWAPDSNILGYSPTNEESSIEKNLDTLFSFYKGQVEQQRWYGFWDHGDVQHTYDPFRHAWRYDVGGFAWDNSELSADLWLWLYFLHTGRGDVFKMAEAMTRHTGEVDVYHSGTFKGFGTRHGVQHWSDSSKQLRISNALYRRIYYYLTGDERVGDLIAELEDSQFALLGLDSHRKVQKHSGIPEGFAMTNIGLDFGPLAAAWLTAWERRTEGWTQARDLLVRMLEGISGLRHGIGNNAALLNPSTGEIRECPPPTPKYAISHLSMLFGFPETFAELLDYARDGYPSVVENFMKVWLPYCRAYNGGSAVQLEEYGFEFPPSAGWRQSHSTITAFAAVEQNNDKLAKIAWGQFFNSEGSGNNSGGYGKDHDWTVVNTSPPEFFCEGQEAPWITTNEAARYGVSAIFNLANLRTHL
ncbi:protein yetA [Seiridium cupressi]